MGAQTTSLVGSRDLVAFTPLGSGAKDKVLGLLGFNVPGKERYEHLLSMIALACFCRVPGP